MRASSKKSARLMQRNEKGHQQDLMQTVPSANKGECLKRATLKPVDEDEEARVEMNCDL
jgi:hypothetical protein